MTVQDDIVYNLRNIPWFLELNENQLQKLADLSSYCDIGAGENLFVEGDRIEYIYIVLEGELEINYLVPQKGQLIIFTAEPLDVLGWDALTPVARQRVGTAHAVLPSHLLKTPGAELVELCDRDHDIGYVIMKRLANVIAGRLLSTRVHLFNLYMQNG
jgi:CRP-like cAMP-binding protein